MLRDADAHKTERETAEITIYCVSVYNGLFTSDMDQVLFTDATSVWYSHAFQNFACISAHRMTNSVKYTTLDFATPHPVWTVAAVVLGPSHIAIPYSHFLQI